MTAETRTDRFVEALHRKGGQEGVGEVRLGHAPSRRPIAVRCDNMR